MLILGGTAFSDAGLKYLKELPQLQSLNLLDEITTLPGTTQGIPPTPIAVPVGCEVQHAGFCQY